MPTEPSPSQASQAPSQARSQQTPSAQAPSAQSASVAQDAAPARLQTPLALQVWSPAQLSGSGALTTGSHCPVVAEQASHTSHSEVLQQAPSTQATPSQSASSSQVPPSARYSQV